MIEVSARDRVLLLSIPDLSLVRELARKASEGIVVGLGSDDEVRAARRALADLENVMFVAAPPEEIPWREDFFTKVLDLKCQWAQPGQAACEVVRVMAPKGTVHVLPSTRDFLLRAANTYKPDVIIRTCQS